MKVLVACEESQRVCIAFRERGHEAYSCDLQDCSGGHPEWHICGDALDAIQGGVIATSDMRLHEIGKWDLIIAHPPCTYLSNAGARWMYNIINGKRYIDADRYIAMTKGRSFFFEMLNADCKKIAIENPVPMRICDLPPPTQIIQPYQFGHPYSKKTQLWLKNLSPLKPTKELAEYTPWCPSSTSAFAKGKGGSKGAIRGQKNYSKTFQGIANAMAEQWG